MWVRNVIDTVFEMDDGTRVLTKLHTQDGYARLVKRMLSYLWRGGDLQTICDRAAWLSRNVESDRTLSSMWAIFSKTMAWDEIDVTGQWDVMLEEVATLKSDEDFLPEETVTREAVEMLAEDIQSEREVSADESVHAKLPMRSDGPQVPVE
jgi:hypothetical protein